ncbi:hypothetical protein VQ056_06420 [Paenibacillus sp. JTLBN-2024]
MKPLKSSYIGMGFSTIFRSGEWLCRLREKVIKPVMIAAQPAHIVEIGS